MLSMELVDDAIQAGVGFREGPKVFSRYKIIYTKIYLSTTVVNDLKFEIRKFEKFGFIIPEL